MGMTFAWVLMVMVRCVCHFGVWLTRYLWFHLRTLPCGISCALQDFYVCAGLRWLWL